MVSFKKKREKEKEIGLVKLFCMLFILEFKIILIVGNFWKLTKILLAKNVTKLIRVIFVGF